MMKAKTGRWLKENPQRGRSNNSALLIRNETTRELFSKIMKSTKEFGEPGFVWAEDRDIGFNPCCEIGMYPKTVDGESGFQFCNLTEINGKWCDTEENFYQACRASAIIGTIQASYTNFGYVSDATRKITEHEALLGCSVTGMMDNPDILFDPKIQKRGAEIILEVNAKIAEMIGINPCARATCTKPAGCLYYKTPIKTIDGIKTLEEIFEDQGYKLKDIKDFSDEWLKLNKPLFIYNEDDKLEEVTKLYVNGIINVYEIPLENGDIIKCTPWHKFKLIDGSWKRADELNEDDDLMVF